MLILRQSQRPNRQVPAPAINQNRPDRPVASFDLHANYWLKEGGRVNRGSNLALYDAIGHSRLSEKLSVAQLQSGVWLPEFNLEPPMAARLYRATLALVTEAEAIEARLLAQLMANKPDPEIINHNFEAILDLRFDLSPGPMVLGRTILRIGDNGHLGQLRIWRHHSADFSPAGFSFESDCKSAQARDLMELLRDHDQQVQATLSGLPSLFATLMANDGPSRKFDTSSGVWYHWSNDG